MRENGIGVRGCPIRALALQERSRRRSEQASPFLTSSVLAGCQSEASP